MHRASGPGRGKAVLMKSTKVQTLGELRMRGTANGWAGLLAFIRGLPLVATVVDSMRESIHTLRCGFLCLQGTQSKQIRSR